MTDLARLATSIPAQQSAFVAGELTALEMTKFYLQQIGEHNPRLNIFWHVDAESAQTDANASDRRRARGQSLSELDGICVAIKDNIEVMNMPCTAGLAFRRAQIATQDAYCVKQLRAAGAIVLGKLSMHEGALGADNDNPHFGACHNPHRFGFTPGGSSGGSAAAVAAKMCAASLGTDTMGSVRIPAAYCGVTGFKPSYGRVSVGGVVPACFALDHVGVVAHCPEDAEVVYRHLVQRDRDDAWQITEFSAPGAISKIGYLRNVEAHGVNEDVALAYRSALDQLLDFALQGIDIGWSFGAYRRAGLLATEADMAYVHRVALEQTPEQFSPELRSMLQFAQSKSAPDLAKARVAMQSARQQAHQLFAEHAIDAMILPTTPQVAFAFGSPTPANQADLTSMANFAGFPALSLPLRIEDGLPIGLQIVAKPSAEVPLLQLAQRILDRLHDQ